MVARVWIGFVVIALLCAFTFTIVHGADKLVSADDDEFENDEEVVRPGVPLFPQNSQPSKTLEQADEAFDADEFEGIETLKKPEVQEVEEEATPEPVEPKIPPKPKFGTLEICYITFISIFLANYFIGKKKNEKIATTWGTHFQTLFSNFTKFGDGNRFLITKESAYTFSVTCSGGRPRCVGAVFTLDLNKRHDLSSYVYGIFTPHKDTLTIDVAMHTNQPFCFALGKKKEERQLLKTYKDIAEFAVPVKSPPRLANYSIFTDSPEILDDIFTKDIVEVLSTNEQYFSSLEYSDVSPTYLGHKTILRIVYRLPPVDQLKNMSDLMRIVFPLIDNFAGVALTKTTFSKNENLRKKKQTQEKSEHEKLQEIAQKKKQDRLQAERAAYEKLSPEAQRKFDEKEEKRKLKAKQSKVRVVYS
eukprot:Phypoly_transcript_09139.p1 GENE.Phypoly_transcript_09139~~Phypoly_transcript_09139.p1  ORF type:complete len:417 (+),score=84.05 Phypoly_transcript_09139:81-1331(+)